MDEIKNIFVDKNEQMIASLGGGYITNYLKTGDISKGLCIVTDKRVYFCGNCYYKEGGRYKQSSEERIIDLKDVTGSGTVHESPVLLPLLGLACFLGAPIIGSNGSSGGAIFMVILSFVLIIVSVLRKKDIFSIEYAGGAVAFTASDYNKEETIQFQKNLRMAKDKYVSKEFVTTDVKQESNGSLVDEILKYKELYDKGVITQEEFETLKKRIIG